MVSYVSYVVYLEVYVTRVLLAPLVVFGPVAVAWKVVEGFTGKKDYGNDSKKQSNCPTVDTSSRRLLRLGVALFGPK